MCGCTSVSSLPFLAAESAPQALVIGASAGGIEALLTLLPALPSSLPAVVLLVLHRRRDVGLPDLAALLGHHCALPVREALDHEPLQPGQVLLAPADHHLLVDPGPVVALSLDPPLHHCRPAIDLTLDSASRCWRQQLLALVLTGANHDGAAGALAVRQRGGRVWVEDPATARASTMPAAALAAAGADRVLSLAGLAEALSTLGQAQPLSPDPSDPPAPGAGPQPPREPRRLR